MTEEPDLAAAAALLPVVDDGVEYYVSQTWRLGFVPVVFRKNSKFHFWCVMETSKATSDSRGDPTLTSINITGTTSSASMMMQRPLTERQIERLDAYSDMGMQNPWYTAIMVDHEGHENGKVIIDAAKKPEALARIDMRNTRGFASTYAANELAKCVGIPGRFAFARLPPLRWKHVVEDGVMPNPEFDIKAYGIPLTYGRSISNIAAYLFNVTAWGAIHDLAPAVFDAGEDGKTYEHRDREVLTAIVHDAVMNGLTPPIFGKSLTGTSRRHKGLHANYCDRLVVDVSDSYPDWPLPGDSTDTDLSRTSVLRMPYTPQIERGDRVIRDCLSVAKSFIAQLIIAKPDIVVDASGDDMMSLIACAACVLDPRATA